MPEVAAPPLRILHLGCGRRGKEGFPDDAIVTTLDADPLLEPDIVCTLGKQPLPLPDDSVDLAVAIHVLEHIGRQGETDEWFFFWEELYRVMAPDGQLQFESPLWSSVWCWADPQHTRALSPQSFVFFSQDHYRIPGSSITPYRIKCDFEALNFVARADTNPNIAEREDVSHFRGCLVAKKPLKPWWAD